MDGEQKKLVDFGIPVDGMVGLLLMDPLSRIWDGEKKG